MHLKQKESGDLFKISDIVMLINPNQSQVKGRVQMGEEEQPEQPMDKAQLVFPSGETLPKCWLDPNYTQAGNC
ncbi:MAG: acetyltransferase [Microcoleaceae cyanobacterium]